VIYDHQFQTIRKKTIYIFIHPILKKNPFPDCLVLTVLDFIRLPGSGQRHCSKFYGHFTRYERKGGRSSSSDARDEHDERSVLHSKNLVLFPSKMIREYNIKSPFLHNFLHFNPDSFKLLIPIYH